MAVLVVLFAAICVGVSAKIDEPFIIISNLPSCGANESVVFNGTQLLCRAIPERECNCPEVFPDPPEGCQSFSPPLRGGFVCLREPDAIYCSVLCDNTSEFSSGVPLNPYHCGPDTGFQWNDFTGQSHKSLPECDGFRRSSTRTLFQDSFYFPVPCSQLTEDQEMEFSLNLISDLELFFDCRECESDEVFIQCPTYSPPPSPPTPPPPTTYPPPSSYHHKSP